MSGDCMDYYRGTLRAVLAQLIKTGRVKHLADWCRQAGFPDSTVHNFLSGRTHSLTINTVASLARAVDLPVSAILGELAPRSDKERLILETYLATDDSGKQLLEALIDRERSRIGPR